MFVRSSSLSAGEHESIPLLVVSGEIDLDTGPQLRQHFERLLETKPAAIVVDLSEVSFMDSTGLGVLNAARRQLRRAEGRLILVGCQPVILTHLRLTNTLPLFTIVANGSEAADLLSE